MSVIYIVDGYPPKPYDARTLITEATGGTMADVIILAETLSERGHDVHVLQHDPPTPSVGRARYASVHGAPDRPAPDAVVYVRGEWLMAEGHHSPPEVRKRSPSCRFVYWPHVTYPQPFTTWWGHVYGVWTAPRRASLGRLLQRQGISVVGVSAYHADTIRRAWPWLDVDWIYNPVEDVSAEHAAAEPSNDRILYASSPERGLKRAIEVVARVRRERPDMRLYVATPGYPAARRFLASARRRYGDTAVELGHLRRPELFAQMRRALCLLQPNTIFRESFGRVYAEAHVLGTPVLTSAMGAATETVASSDQLLATRRIGEAVDRILHWAEGGRPVVQANPAFAPHPVAARWEALLGLGGAVAATPDNARPSVFPRGPS